MTKKIALISQLFYPEMTSTGLHMTELATGLAREGWDIRVYCAFPAKSEEDVPARMTYEGVEVVRVPSLGETHGSVLARGLNAFSFLFYVGLGLIRDRKSLAGIFNTTNPPFLGLAAIAAKWISRLPVVTLVYDVYPNVAVCIGLMEERSFTVKLWERITKFIFNRSDALIVIGRDMKEIVKGKLHSPQNMRIDLFPNWSDHTKVYPVDPDENPFVAEHDEMKDKFVVQYSGNLGRTHTLEPLIEAANLLQKEPVLFQLIGSGAKKELLMDMAQAYGLDNVQFLPYQPFDELMNVLSAPDLSVVCLQQECTGVSVPSKTYGIMAAGRPILGFMSLDSEIAQTIDEYQCGIVLEKPTGELVAQQIREFIQDSERIKKMGESGYSAFKENFTLDRAVERYSNLFHEYFSEANQN